MGRIVAGEVFRMHELFANHWLFKGLPLDSKELIYGKGALIELGAGDLIIEQTEPNGVLFLVLAGELRIAHPDAPEGGSGLTIGVVGSGGLLGDYSFIDGLPASATVTAQEKSLLHGIGHDILHGILDSDPSITVVIYRNLLEHYVARLRSVGAELESFLLLKMQ